MVNQLLNRKRKRATIDKLIVDGQTLTCPTKIAQSMNDYFCNIAQELKTNPNADPELDPNKRCLTNITLTPTTAEEIGLIIKSFKNKSTADSSILAIKHVNSKIAKI